MRDDIFLTEDGDLRITNGDISLTESVRQAVLVRLRWFFSEWRFAPEYGVPYFEQILIKNPNLSGIKSIFRTEIMSVEGVIDCKDINIKLDNFKRHADISFNILTSEGLYREEVRIFAYST